MRGISSRQPQSVHSSGFLWEEWGMPNLDCRPVEFRPSLPLAHILEEYVLKW